jgi:hypothetical protein
MLIGFALNAAVLVLLVWLIAPQQNEFQFWRMFFIAIAVGVVGSAFQLGSGWILGLASEVLAGAFLCLLLVRFCALTARQAVIVSCLYFVVGVVIGLLFDPLLGSISRLLLR